MLLNLLMHAPRSARQVTEHLDMDIQRAYYLLRKLERVGIAEVECEPGAGGQVPKRYTVAPRWFIPYEVTRAETLNAFVEAQIMPRMERFVGLSVELLQQHQPTWGFWLETEGQATNLRMGDAKAPANALFTGDEPFLLNLGTARLSRANASELKRRLVAVLEELESMESPDADVYTVAVMLVRGNVG